MYIMRALYEYTARNPDELSFKAYDIIEVTEYTNNLMAGGWEDWILKLDSSQGHILKIYRFNKTNNLV